MLSGNSTGTGGVIPFLVVSKEVHSCVKEVAVDDSTTVMRTHPPAEPTAGMSCPCLCLCAPVFVSMAAPVFASVSECPLVCVSLPVSCFCPCLSRCLRSFVCPCQCLVLYVCGAVNGSVVFYQSLFDSVRFLVGEWMSLWQVRTRSSRSKPCHSATSLSCAARHLIIV